MSREDYKKQVAEVVEDSPEHPARRARSPSEMGVDIPKQFLDSILSSFFCAVLPQVSFSKDTLRSIVLHYEKWPS